MGGDETNGLSYYHIDLELTRGYIAKLKYLRREKDDDVKYRLNQALNLCKFEDGRPIPMPLDGTKEIRPTVVRTYPKKYKAHLVIPTSGFTDPGFRPGTLLDALKTWFGECIKGDIKMSREWEPINVG